MIYKFNIHTDLQITTLEDLGKLKPFLEDGTWKVSKSQIARELKKDRHTVDKYLKGYQKNKQRTRSSYLDSYYEIIKELLPTSSQQIFYYKSTLWQYLVDNHGLTCSESSFRRYICKHSEFRRILINEKNIQFQTKHTYVMKQNPENKRSLIGKNRFLLL